MASQINVFKGNTLGPFTDSQEHWDFCFFSFYREGPQASVCPSLNRCCLLEWCFSKISVSRPSFLRNTPSLVSHYLLPWLIAVFTDGSGNAIFIWFVNVTTRYSFLIGCFKVFLHCSGIGWMGPWPQLSIIGWTMNASSKKSGCMLSKLYSPKCCVCHRVSHITLFFPRWSDFVLLFTWSWLFPAQFSHLFPWYFSVVQITEYFFVL